LEFPEAVLTQGKKGRLEIRGLDKRGQFVTCKYLDPKTMKSTDQKRKLMLRDENGKIVEYFIIPMKDPKRALLISTETDEKERQVWNEELGKAEDIWKD
jgi:hypothetical protein